MLKIEMAGSSDDIIAIQQKLGGTLPEDTTRLHIKPASHRDFSVIELIVTSLITGVMSSAFDIIKEVIINKLKKSSSPAEHPMMSIRVNDTVINIRNEEDLDAFWKLLNAKNDEK